MYRLVSLPSETDNWVRRRFIEQDEPTRFFACDPGIGEYCSEVECAFDDAGNLIVRDRRTWKHEIELKANEDPENQ
ncbi:hypothetical protein Hden_1203 [Hyphomicrobium denitrificans ATCC 51888]|uniref:Uncharacterized protein n=1 Tax=Hyphomicrobium denitrificans (strain ATCC 51888 / DSM 1869 / NCIMB 11706 / TK 0415) TaxID=582899 RepID=D8JWA2_HYPDA|nr:hypothetical protein [Hyphomicrobium denitrificans]ADJ23015.1 hypothetical protein Hden_1203 [Hyphomicrobium denitrificans ATCC 51888]